MVKILDCEDRGAEWQAFVLAVLKFLVLLLHILLFTKAS
jgi:hypothetical protein